MGQGYRFLYSDVQLNLFLTVRVGIAFPHLYFQNTVISEFSHNDMGI